MHTAPVTRPGRAAFLTLILLLAACVDAGTRTRTRDADVSRTQAGDTLIVHTRSAGRWGDDARLVPAASFGVATGTDTTMLGRIIALTAAPDGRVFASDRQALTVRVFDSLLRPIALWGREGSGPGELREPDGGLAVLSDGRVAVRDPGNARVQLFDDGGHSAGTWPLIDAGLRTRNNFARQGDTLLSRVVVDATGPIDRWRYGLVRITPDGGVRDTVALPESTLPPARLVARGGNNTAEIAVPFAPVSLWAWHPAGGFAIANGDRYAITWPSTTGFVRAERAVSAAPVTNAEVEQEREYVTKGLQWLDPSWTWNGPEIPRTKPFVSALFTGIDGSVWVLREGAAEDRDDPDYTPGDAASVERRLRSRRTFDVFEAAGDLLGSVAVPEDMRLQPEPVFDAAGIVAVTLDADGVPRLVRYRVRIP